MNNNINQELQKIKIPKDLHERSKLGVKKAKAEQQKRRIKSPLVAAVILGLSITSVAFAMPSIASQLPFMDNFITFFDDKKQDYENFEKFSTEIGLVQSSNGITVMIDNAVFDGTNVTVSYAIETDHNFDGFIQVREPFYVPEKGGSSGTGRITKINENRFVGLSTFTPILRDNQQQETIEVIWEPEAFYSPTNDLEVKGDWSFSFSLNRLEGDLRLVNQTVQHEAVSFTLQSVEFTDVSTVINYEQVVLEELLKVWASVTPVFHVTDDLGHVYMNGSAGAGWTADDYKTFKGTSDFGRVKEGASKLIIQPIQIASSNYGKGHTKLELEPIVIDLKK
ncbi:MAG: DUF4179 domain-containing protein [Anaerobacillus sp.]|uniref:DUF4179 domain-containing protein n=1 Tax=Anaerobacillus sp. TaxID=1872506 RepID=UPI0039196B13